MGKITLRIFESLTFRLTLTFVVGFTLSTITGTNGQNEYRQGYTYKICAKDNLCLSSFEKPSLEEGLGKVTVEKYVNVPEQHWLAKQGYLHAEYGLSILVPQTNKYNDVTYSLVPQQSSSPFTNFWRISAVPDEEPWYTIQLFTHALNETETVVNKEHTLGCIQHMGQKLRVQVLPCTYNEFQKWKFGITTYTGLILQGSKPGQIIQGSKPGQIIQGSKPGLIL